MAIQVLTPASPAPLLVEIGGLVSPMPAPLVLTALPTNDNLTLTGTLVSGNSTGNLPIPTPIILPRAGSQGGKPRWAAGIWAVYYNTGLGEWDIETSDFSYLALVTSAAATPAGLLGWSLLPDGVTGQPTLTGGPTPAITAIGQLALATVGGVTSVWLAQSLTEWRRLTP